MGDADGPEQDLTSWYPEKAWIAPEKEETAKAIAAKYQLSLYAPVDMATGVWLPAPPTTSHHLELTYLWGTVLVAHPQYLKVRALGKPPNYRYAWEPLRPITLGPGILEDLSANE